MTKARELLDEADRVFKSREYAESRDIYQKTADACDQDDPADAEVYVEALAQIARSHLVTGEKEEGRSWIAKVAQLVDGETQPRGWARYLGVRGRFEWKNDENETATQTFNEMYDYCVERELHDFAVDAAHMAAITAPSTDQIEWAHKGIAAAEAGNLTGWLGPLWNNLGWTHDEMGNHAEALKALTEARKYHYQSERDIPKLVADYSVGVQYRKLGQLDEALRWLKPAMEWAERLYAGKPTPVHAEWFGWTHKEMGELSLQQGDSSAEGKSHFETAVSKLREANMPEWDADGFAELEKRLAELK